MELPHHLHTFISFFQNRGDTIFISEQHSNVFILEHPMFKLNYITQTLFDNKILSQQALFIYLITLN